MASRKIVLITGGNGGLGYEAVKAFFESEKAYRIFMGSRSIEKGKEAIDKIRQECPTATNTLDLVQLDLASDKSIDQAFDQVQSEAGYIDALVNNAGEYARR
jgi:NAD(P)-dependent dehydrogenase (short-subunit alcohol dehydrogenase family)